MFTDIFDHVLSAFLNEACDCVCVVTDISCDPERLPANTFKINLDKIRISLVLNTFGKILVNVGTQQHHKGLVICI